MPVPTLNEFDVTSDSPYRSRQTSQDFLEENQTPTRRVALPCLPLIWKIMWGHGMCQSRKSVIFLFLKFLMSEKKRRKKYDSGFRRTATSKRISGCRRLVSVYSSCYLKRKWHDSMHDLQLMSAVCLWSTYDLMFLRRSLSRGGGGCLNKRGWRSLPCPALIFISLSAPLWLTGWLMRSQSVFHSNVCRILPEKTNYTFL